jgi:hypothetical protein
MKIVSLNLYTYNELTPKAQEYARDKWREHTEVDLKFALDDAKAVGRHLGFDIERIPYCGFYSQGDGASITGDWVADRVDPVHLKEHAPVDTALAAICETLSAIAIRNLEATVKLSPSGHYCHEYSVSYDYYDMAEADETPFEEAAREFMRWIYARLEEDYEHQTSDETIAETLINNECYFTQEGKMHHE